MKRSISRLLHLSVFLLTCSYTTAQMTERKRMKTDSLFALAKDNSRPIDERLKHYNNIALTVYKDIDYGREICRAYFVTARQNNRPKHVMSALAPLGFTYLAKGELDSCDYFYSLELQLAETHNDSRKKSHAYADLGNLYEAKGDLNKSLEFHLKSLAITTANDYKTQQARAKINIGHIYELQGKYRESLDALKEAEILCEKTKDVGYRASLYMHFGEVNAGIGEDTTAMRYFRLALKWAEKYYNHGKRMQAKQKIAQLFEQAGQNDSAMAYYAAASTLAGEQQLHYYNTTSVCGMARIHIAQGDYAKARSLAEEAIRTSISNGTSNELGEAYLLKGQVDFQLGAYESSRMMFEKAYASAKENKKIKTQLQACLWLYKFYKQTGNSTRSLAYFEEYNELSLALKNQDMMKSVIKSEIKADYRRRHVADSLQKAKEIAAIQTRYLETERTHQRNLYFVLGGTGLLFLLAAFGYWGYRQKKKNNLFLTEKNRQIERALSDKEALLKEVHHRVKNNMQVVSSLLLLKSKNTSDNVAREALLDSQSRIASMQLAHQKMYLEDNFEELEITGYCREIVHLLLHQELNNAIHCEVSGTKIPVHVEQAQAAGFIIHELVTNSIKHAWKETQDGKTITIRLSESENRIVINYADNGKGVKDGFDFSGDGNFGLRLVNSLVERQLMGSIRILQEKGFAAQIEFSRR